MSSDRGNSPKSKSLLRLLFPELQLFEYFQSVGFVNKKQLKASMPWVFRKKQSGNDDIAFQDDLVCQMREQGTVNNSGTGELIQRSAISSAPAVAFEDYSKTQKNRQQVEMSFQKTLAEMSRYVLGQTEYLQGLLKGVKRPLAEGKASGIKNIIFISGSKGTGRHLSIRVMARLLKEQKILTNDNIVGVDLARYATEKDAERLFIPDLYKALYGDNEIVVFDNFELCHDTVLDHIINLCVEEKLFVNKRFIDQVTAMREVTGSLELDTQDNLDVSGKYFFFITNMTREKVLLKFPVKLTRKIFDIVSTQPLTEDVLKTIAAFQLKECEQDVHNHLGVAMHFAPAVTDFVLLYYDKSMGAVGLEKFIDEGIYRQIVDLQLSGKITIGETYTVNFEQGQVMLVSDQKNVILPSRVSADNKDNLEELNKDLEKVIGLSSIKAFIASLEDNLRIQRAREALGFNQAKNSLHMIFTGNPGTGKTTIARLVAKYLKALGYLSSGHLVEVSRSDLVGQYVGETAQKTMKKINSAKGGVLFIDEAYALVRGNRDIYGVEAVDTLVKAMEDFRDDLVVILAGYTKEMEDFITTNSGLKSRFTHNIEFPDYTPEELLDIAHVLADGKGYRIDFGSNDMLLQMFGKKQIPGKNDSGNGRLARNLVEQAITRQSQRLIASGSELDQRNINILYAIDFELSELKPFDLEAEFQEIVGVNVVKDFLRTLEKQVVANRKRKAAGLSVRTEQSLNMVFTGNPGTGKTTIARLVARMLMNMGYLKSEKVIETDRSGLVAEYMGQSAKKTTDVFMSALGGVLFIDEAYGLVTGSFDRYGKESLDTLVKLVEDHRENIVVIMAGYEKEMQEFMRINSGLQSRFPLQVYFPDYSTDELWAIGKKMIAGKGFDLTAEAEIKLREVLEGFRQAGGNGRMVRNTVENAVRKQSARIAVSDGVAVGEMVLLEAEDFAEEDRRRDCEFDLEKALSGIIGLEEVKEFILSLQAQLQLKEQRKLLGLPDQNEQTLHMVFTGNPGTGKTMMARIIGEVFYHLNVLKTKKFFETDRSGLVAGYVGQTALKTKEVVQLALDGILFIDEAYSLASDAGSQHHPYGKEAIDTLVKAMDDNRDHLIVILAGYSKDMERFLATNPGLKSRFPTIIHFPDYSSTELMTIAQGLYAKRGYALDAAAIEKLQDIFVHQAGASDFGNGRYVRNIFEKSLRAQAVRLRGKNVTREELITITGLDICEV